MSTSVLLKRKPTMHHPPLLLLVEHERRALPEKLPLQVRRLPPHPLVRVERRLADVHVPIVLQVPLGLERPPSVPRDAVRPAHVGGAHVLPPRLGLHPLRIGRVDEDPYRIVLPVVVEVRPGRGEGALPHPLGVDSLDVEGTSSVGLGGLLAGVPDEDHGGPSHDQRLTQRLQERVVLPLELLRDDQLPLPRQVHPWRRHGPPLANRRDPALPFYRLLDDVVHVPRRGRVDGGRWQERIRLRVGGDVVHDVSHHHPGLAHFGVLILLLLLEEVQGIRNPQRRVAVDGALPQKPPRHRGVLPPLLLGVEGALADQYVPPVGQVPPVLEVAPSVLPPSHDPRPVDGPVGLPPGRDLDVLPVGRGHGPELVSLHRVLGRDAVLGELALRDGPVRGLQRALPAPSHVRTPDEQVLPPVGLDRLLLGGPYHGEGHGPHEHGLSQLAQVLVILRGELVVHDEGPVPGEVDGGVGGGPSRRGVRVVRFEGRIKC
mmetsp:Transcript_58966/g.125262  ORF Transcript_58966/g.125262 Transcript_58966/m.125262 type:complete len:487 (+) Transcript_58966:140-1600(+)